MNIRTIATVGIVLAGGFAVGQPGGTSAAAPPTAKYVCLIIADGARPDYITKNIKLLPNLANMMRRGRWYDRAWVGDLVSVTPVSHAVIGTGSLPNHDGGLVNWDWGIHSKGVSSPSLQDIHNFQNGYALGMVRNSGTPTLAGVIHARYHKGLVVAGGGWHFHGEGLMGGPAANWMFYYQRNGKGYFAPFTLGQHAAPKRLLQDPSLRIKLSKSNGSTVPLGADPVRLGQQDTMALKFAARTVRLYKPRAMMVNAPEPDIVGHWTKHWAADEKRIFRSFDRDLAMLANAYKQAGIFNQTLFVIAADHGMMQSTHRVASLPAVKKILASQGASTIMINGGGLAGPTMNVIWIKRPAMNRRVAMAIYRKHLSGVSAVFYLQRTGNQYAYQMAGCESCSPQLVSAYRYLVGTTSGPTGEDIAVLFRENTRTSGYDGMIGRHGGADYASQHITLLFSGPGVKPGVSHHPARLVDLAPTIERFMGMTPQARDGLVLADGFQQPLAADVATQAASDPAMGAYIDALAARAHEDMLRQARPRVQQGSIVDVDLAEDMPGLQPDADLLRWYSCSWGKLAFCSYDQAYL